MNIDPTIRLKRLQYRSRHRGCKETDQILGRFADEALPTLEVGTLDLYEELLEEHDADIWDWVAGKTPTPSHYESLVQSLKHYGLPANCA